MSLCVFLSALVTKRITVSSAYKGPFLESSDYKVMKCWADEKAIKRNSMFILKVH